MNDFTRKINLKDSLATRLLRYIFGLYAMLTIVITVSQLFFEYNHTKKVVFKDIIHFEETFKDGFAKALWEYNRGQLDATLSGLGKVEAIAGVKITDESHNMFANIGEYDMPERRGVTGLIRQVEKNKRLIQVDYPFGSILDTLFGFEFKLFKKSEDPSEGVKFVGIGTIYSSQRILFKKIQYGFMLILINSVIKTIGLWIIFIVITRIMVTKPLEKFSAALYVMDTKNPKEDTNIADLAKRNDELGLLAKSFQNLIRSISENIVIINDLNENLEAKVEDRTQKLAEKTKDVQTMLEHINQGIFTITKDGTVHPEYSKFLETIYQQLTISGVKYDQLLFQHINMESSIKEQAMAAISSSLGMDVFAFEMNKHHLPTEIKQLHSDHTEDKIIEVDWAPITDEQETVHKILVALRDVTEIRKIHEKAGIQQLELEMIGHLIAVGPKRFKDFYNQCHKFLTKNQEIINGKNDNYDESTKVLFRNMHTIKGNAKTIGLTYIVERVHNAEKFYSTLMETKAPWNVQEMLSDIDGIFEQLNRYKSLFDSKLSNQNAMDSQNGNIDAIDLELISAIDKMLDNTNTIDINAIKHLRIRKKYDSLESILKDEINSLDQMSATLNKLTPQVVIKDNNILWKKEFASVIKDIMGHCLRNSIDHGIEDEAKRIKAGKSPQGHIFLETKVKENSIEMHLRDDGQGLNLAALSKKTGQLNVSDEILAQAIFQSGVSTASTVTTISGRGVGMDAVKAFIEEHQGHISIEFTSEKNPDGFRPMELKIIFPKDLGLQA